MRVDVVHPGELGLGEVSAWHAMQQATPSLGNPFLSPEFAVAVGRLRPESRVAVLTDSGSVVGFFPFERRRFGLGVPISGWLSPCHGLIHAPGVEWDPRELLRGCRLAAWKFDNLIPAQKPFTPFHACVDPAPVIELSDGFDAYYAKLRVKSPHLCRELERKARKLDREVGELRSTTASGSGRAAHADRVEVGPVPEDRPRRPLRAPLARRPARIAADRARGLPQRRAVRSLRG